MSMVPIVRGGVVLMGCFWLACSGQISQTGGSGGHAGSGGAATTGTTSSTGSGTTSDATTTTSTTSTTTGDTSGSSGPTGGAAGGTTGSGGSGGRGTGGMNGGGRAGTGGGAGTSVDGGTAGSVEQLCVDTINMYRATLGLAPYARWTAEETCADGQAQSDSQTGTAHGAFGKCSEFAQNECSGWPNPPDKAITGCLQAMWNEGPGADFNTHGHYINMSSTKYTQVACGFYTTSAGKIWAVQDFK
jgi:Cysteine-rich secretory protein family